jgi:hypothetical protein
MSTALAIASVTQVLKDLLNDGLINHDVTGVIGSTVLVTALPPDRIDTGTTSEQSQLNLFMYQATTNAGWRNNGFPAFDSAGARTGNPPLALDLHYILSAYGSNELHMEILLGHGMQLLHETPVLARDAIRRSLTPPVGGVSTGDLPLSLRALATSNLADQVEQIKISPEEMNLEEISKLWTAFGAKYRPTAAYHISVVLIESQRSTKTALPVQARNIYVIPFNQPVITKVGSQSAPNAPVLFDQKILSGYRIVLQGYQFKNDIVLVNVGGVEVTPALADISDTSVTFTVPPSLPAGVHGIQVVHPLLMGSPLQPHTGVSSRSEAFVLSPRIISSQVLNVQGSGNAPRSATVRLQLSPDVTDTQRVMLLLNELNPPVPGVPPRAYSFQLLMSTVLSPPGSLDIINIPITGVRAGAYLVRIQVDGAESPLGTAPNGNYNSPQITIP